MEHGDVSRVHVIGGNLALDFANTVDVTFEYLGSYDDLVAWGRRVRLLSEAESRRLVRKARARPAEAQRSYERARAARDVVTEVFGAVTAGRRPPPSALERLRALGAEAIARGHLAERGGRLEWRWDEDDLDRVVWAVAHAAVALLTSDELRRLKSCPGGGCGWLFLDRSRNRSRRWCSMEHCGTEEKKRRYVARRASRRRRATRSGKRIRPG